VRGSSSQVGSLGNSGTFDSKIDWCGIVGASASSEESRLRLVHPGLFDRYLLRCRCLARGKSTMVGSNALGEGH
jgi:hypothetical protein